MSMSIIFFDNVPSAAYYSYKMIKGLFMKNNDNNKHVNRMLFVILLAGMIPMLVIFVLYFQNKAHPLLNFMYNATQGIPSMTSCYNPIMTKMMDVYGKSAPLLGIITFFILFRKRECKTIADRNTLIRACILGPFIYIFYVYFFLLQNIELTTAGRPIRFMSENNFILLVFYILMYYASFLLTYIICYIPFLAQNIWKERQ
jgi:hypothetical protein